MKKASPWIFTYIAALVFAASACYAALNCFEPKPEPRRAPVIVSHTCLDAYTPPCWDNIDSLYKALPARRKASRDAMDKRKADSPKRLQILRILDWLLLPSW